MGGGSDGNITGALGIPTLDGLGPAGGNAHCSEQSPDGSKEQEYVLASTFVPKALLNIAAITRLNRTPFVLYEQPLWGMEWFQLSDTQALWNSRYHHLICDGTSVGLVGQAVSAAYNQLLRGEQPVLGLNPVPGEVDIVVASELMEAGRALQRGVRPVVLWCTGFAVLGLAAVVAFGIAPLLDEGVRFGARYGAVLVFSAVGGVVPTTAIASLMRVAPTPTTVATTLGLGQQFQPFPDLAVIERQGRALRQRRFVATAGCLALVLVVETVAIHLFLMSRVPWLAWTVGWRA